MLKPFLVFSVALHLNVPEVSKLWFSFSLVASRGEQQQRRHSLPSVLLLRPPNRTSSVGRGREEEEGGTRAPKTGGREEEEGGAGAWSAAPRGTEEEEGGAGGAEEATGSCRAGAQGEGKSSGAAATVVSNKNLNVSLIPTLILLLFLPCNHATNPYVCFILLL